jgi:hypothetical protein
MRATEVLKLAENITGASLVPEVTCTGGLYKLASEGTIGTSKIQFQDPNGGWVDAGAAIVTGIGQDIYLPPGMVRANLGAGAAGAYVYLVRVPFE